ncbi:paraquat-inducible protein A, partial [Burkholderia pseudomallei]|nr:paraquat-inducible protein A [Burkholderia pseudomallei]
ERIGRWSMLDIFVVTLTVALVHFRSLAVITAGPGAPAFGSCCGPCGLFMSIP